MGGEKKDLGEKEGYGDKKEGYGDKKDMGGKGGEEKEPSAELKAAMKSCTENELCKKLMECKKKHKESGGKGDHDKEEVCVEEMKACAADKECSMLHEKLQAAMKKDSGYGDKKEGYGDKKEGYGDKKEGSGDKKEGSGDKKEGYGDKKEG